SPASLSALGTASTGPTPIISGGTPATANDLNLSCGVNPSASAFSRSISRTDPAPSLICEELPAVTDPVVENAGLNLASISGVVPERTPSSVSNVFLTSTMFPSSPTTRSTISYGTISSLNLPDLIAASARSCLCAAKASCSALEIENLFATSSAV